MFKRLLNRNSDKSIKKSKSDLDTLNDINRLSKEDMNRLLGGNENKNEKIESTANLFNLRPCTGELPQ